MTDMEVATYHLRSAECAEMAQQMADPARKLTLLNMARAWLELADRVEKRTASSATCPAPPQAEHVAQQQQQPQPETE